MNINKLSTGQKYSLMVLAILLILIVSFIQYSTNEQTGEPTVRQEDTVMQESNDGITEEGLTSSETAPEKNKEEVIEEEPLSETSSHEINWEELGIPVPTGTIKGLYLGDIYIHYTSRGFDKSRPFKIAKDVTSPDAGKYMWSLSKFDDNNFCSYDLTIYGPDTLTIDKILASVICPNPNDLMTVASKYLNFVVGIEYTGADVNQAKSFIKKTLGKKQGETIIGGVRFKFKQGTAKSIYLYLLG